MILVSKDYFYEKVNNARIMGEVFLGENDAVFYFLDCLFEDVYLKTKDEWGERYYTLSKQLKEDEMHASIRKLGEIEHTVYIDEETGEEIVVLPSECIKELVKEYQQMGYQIEYSESDGWLCVTGRSDEYLDC